MAIAYVNGNTSNASASSLTYSVTCTGANFLLVDVYYTGSSISSVTYNGVSMSLANAQTSHSVYYLANPSTGANNVVVTMAASTTIFSSAVCYSGVATTGNPIASVGGNNVDEVTLAITVSHPPDYSLVSFGALSIPQTGVTCVFGGGGVSSRQNTSAKNVSDILNIDTAISSFGVGAVADIQSFQQVYLITVAIKQATADPVSTAGFLMQYLAQQ
jgi:hypothetical protein